LRIVVVLVSVLVLGVAGSAHGATQGCDAASATPLIRATDPDTNRRVVEAVHCGAFLGPASDAMLVVIASQGGCEGIGGWQVFKLVDGSWQPSADGRHGWSVIRHREGLRSGRHHASAGLGDGT
jgi:hypothetical protein